MHYRFSVNTKVFGVTASSIEGRMLVFKIDKIRSKAFNDIKMKNISITYDHCEFTSRILHLDRVACHAGEEITILTRTILFTLDENIKLIDLMWLERAIKRVQEAVGGAAKTEDDHQHTQTSRYRYRRLSLSDAEVNQDAQLESMVSKKVVFTIETI